MLRIRLFSGETGKRSTIASGDSQNYQEFRRCAKFMYDDRRPRSAKYEVFREFPFPFWFCCRIDRAPHERGRLAAGR